MRYQITKIKNGSWKYENEKGVKTLHSTQAGAERMAMSQNHLHNPDEEGDKELCEYCNGEGVIATDVDDGEGHTMRGVGDSKPCICQL